MKTIVKFIVIFVLTGCGGPSFTVGAEATNGDDGGPGGAPGTGGMVATGGARVGTGGDHETGGHETGGASTGGTPSATGGAPNATGGLPNATGGVPGTGGVVTVDACALVKHDNGVGQTWQDCVSLGTYNLAQARKACEASFGSGCRTLDPQATCEGVGYVYTSAYAWIYSARQGAGTRAGDVLQYVSGTTYTCPNWPSSVGTWK